MLNTDFGLGFMMGLVCVVVLICVFVLGFEQGQRRCLHAHAVAEVPK